MMGATSAMRLGAGQGANRSDSRSYREDLQRRHAPKRIAEVAPIIEATLKVV